MTGASPRTLDRMTAEISAAAMRTRDAGDARKLRRASRLARSARTEEDAEAAIRVARDIAPAT